MPVLLAKDVALDFSILVCLLAQNVLLNLLVLAKLSLKGGSD